MFEHPQNGRPIVVLVSRCFVIKDSRILAVQRSSTDSHYPSQWECPGGKLDAGQDLNGALEREVVEETGLLVSPIDTLAHYESKLIGGGGKYNGLPYLALFGLATVIGGTLKLSHEHDDANWCTYSELMGLHLTPETQKASIILEKRLREHGVV